MTVKNFDLERAKRASQNRQFKIGGVTLTRRASVRPEAMMEWEAVTPLTPPADVIAAIDNTIVAMVENGGHKAWKALRAREDDAVTLGDMLEVMQWLVEEQSGRPTLPPSPSSTEPVSSGTTSTGASSSRGTKKGSKV